MSDSDQRPVRNTIRAWRILLGEAMGRLAWRYQWLIGGLMVVLLASLFGPTLYAKYTTQSKRYAANQIHAIPERDVAIVPGAGVLPDGTPTPYLKWRVQTAVELYKARKVQKLLVSGDNSDEHYNEPVAMKKLAVTLGVEAEDVVLDYAGLSTYDTCYRARAVFQVRSAIIVTQGYHLPRAVMTCHELGIESIGVAARRQGRDFTLSYILREFVSTDKAVVQLLFKPEPTILGSPQPIKVL